MIPDWGLAVFSVEGTTDNLQFLDPTVFDFYLTAATKLVGYRDAVNHVGYLTMASSAKMKAPRRIISNTGLKLKQVPKFLDWKVCNRLCGNVGGRSRTIHLYEWTLCDDHNFFSFNDRFL